MKVTRVITQELELNFEIIEATLLTAGEAMLIPKRLRKYNNHWWLKTPSFPSGCFAFVYPDGIVSRRDDAVNLGSCDVRPALIISNFKSSGLKIGDRFEFGDKEFEIISTDKAFCLTDIGLYLFREDSKALDDYEKSDIKKYIDEWFEKEMESRK